MIHKMFHKLPQLSPEPKKTNVLSYCEDWEQTPILEAISLVNFPNVTYRKCEDISLKFIGQIESSIISVNA